MREHNFKSRVLLAIAIVFLLLAAGTQEGQTQPPPVSAPVVREGDLAMKLAVALQLGQPSSEVEAESMLGAAGIAPRNGWIADYPVTPDIIGELRDSIGYAAQAKTISTDEETAIKTLESVQAELGISASPGPAGPPETSAGTAETEESGYPNQTTINDYYSSEGPPIVTYYPPPPDYYYLYGWVPYPFWWSGFWFGGYFILHDFHRHFRDHGHVGVVTNHFHDERSNRVFRIDPERRFHGKTFAGIGAPRSNNFLNTGVRSAPERVFNSDAGRSFTSPSRRVVRPQAGASGTARQPSTKSFRPANPFTEKRVYSQPPGAGRTFTPSSASPGGGRRPAAPAGQTRDSGAGRRR